MISFKEGLFFSLAALLIGAAVTTVFSRRVIHSALSLVLAFFAAAALWISLQAEFLGLILVLVYIGAVMTLFLFVIMTIPTHDLESNTDTQSARQRLIPMGVLVGWILLLGYILLHEVEQIPRHPDTIVSYLMRSNAQLLGDRLYTEYLYPFELVGVLLLVAIVATINLCAGQKPDSKRITKRQQIQIQREARVQLVKMEPLSHD